MDKPASCDIRVYLAFYGHFEPEQILRLFSSGAPHVEVYRRGDTRRLTGKQATVDSLEIGTGERQTYDLEAVLDEMHALASDWQEITEQVSKLRLDIFLRVVAYFSSTAPALILTPKHLRWLAELGTTVDMDLYSLS